MGWIKWLGKFLGILPKVADTVAETLAKIGPDAIGVVELITHATPTQRDDELIALYKTYGIPDITAYLALPPADRSLALLNAATKLLQRKWPNLPIGLIRTAIEVARQHVISGKPQQ